MKDEDFGDKKNPVLETPCKIPIYTILFLSFWGTLGVFLTLACILNLCDWEYFYSYFMITLCFYLFREKK